ncbi:type II toxin-antitoxin system VapC family toxin [Candidatus Woesearchaeota archaeon]|nr:type II toxin-antitoxin system VapC family toxin [Candidatus Woesearchaeota archaeon]
MSVFLDTSFLVALANVDDENHRSAQSVKAKIANKELGQPYISDYVFDEFVTFLKARHTRPEKIEEFGDSLLEDESIKMLNVNSAVFSQSWKLFKKSEGLSFTDCTIIVLAGESGIKSIASYDSDFDRLPLLKRIES